MELLVGMAVSALLVGGVLTVLIAAFHVQTAVESRSQIASQANVALERFDADIHNVAVSCSAGEGFSGGASITVSSTAQSIEFCEANPSKPLTATSTTTTPLTQVVEWYCTTPSVGYGSCRRYSAGTASSINNSASAPTTIYGVSAVSISGVLQTSAGQHTATATPFTASVSYPLVPTSSTAGLSWLGVTLKLAQLANPGTAQTTTVSHSQSAQFFAGGELRNFQL